MRRKTIRVAEPVLDGNERDYVLDCLDSTWISSRGKYIERFESAFAEFCEVPYAVATNNGTTALHLALAAHNVGPGDEVIVPTLTYVASVNAVRYCGATPVLVDCQGPSLALDPDQVAAKVNPRTRGIVTVPLYGHPVEIDRIESIADRHRLFVVEDAAEALGARYRNRPTGSWGDCATFSFFGNKTITTGEGGMVVTSNPALAERLRLLRGQAVSSDRAYWHTEVGFNYRMTNIAAAIGCAQLERIDELLQRRQQIAAWYNEELGSQGHLVHTPHVATHCQHSYWMYSILLNREFEVHRDALINQLAERGIETRPMFYPVHLMPPYREPDGRYPHAESFATRGVSLPTHGRLTRDDVHYTCQQLVSALTNLTHAVSSNHRRAA
ncbi:MAG: aminotransferase DegT [Planctomycetaceae bacterium]|nr:aminotransferase DegT [Planctomycetaceae bacterium]